MPGHVVNNFYDKSLDELILKQHDCRCVCRSAGYRASYRRCERIGGSIRRLERLATAAVTAALLFGSRIAPSPRPRLQRPSNLSKLARDAFGVKSIGQMASPLVTHHQSLIAATASRRQTLP